MPTLELIALDGLPLVKAGDDLAALVGDALARAGLHLQDDDVLVFAQKVVSKAEGRCVDLRQVQPSTRALELAQRVQKDPRLVELILSESRRVVRAAPQVLIVEHRLGHVMANAGVDQSNVAGADAGEALLLPSDPDASALRLRESLMAQAQCTRLGVVINDSFGRPWRRGATGVAIGCAGLAAWRDLRGQADLFGRRLRVSEVAPADEVAAAASLLMGQADEGLPVVRVRGLCLSGESLPARALVRPAEENLFP